ncbi:hypothetical protein EUTSA_v10017826mg, partial [Eutrema salsugineum]
WWAFNSCPIPKGFDPCLVGRRIETALKKSGYSDLVTITAVGNLREGLGEDVMRKLSSSGISLNHSIRPASVLCYHSMWTRLDTTMLIFGGHNLLEPLALIFHSEAEEGYKYLLAYDHQLVPSSSSRWKVFQNNARKEWLWESLLSDDDMDSGSADNEDKTTRIVLQDKCTETGESPWYCSQCELACQSLEDFTTHLKGGEHGFWMWSRYSMFLDLLTLVDALKHSRKKNDEEEEHMAPGVKWFVLLLAGIIVLLMLIF